MTLKKILCLAIALILSVAALVSCGGKDSETLESITIIEGTLAVEYTLGDVIDTSGIRVNAKYKDGSTKEIGTDALKITIPEISAAGEYTIAVEYNGVYAYQNITVNAPAAERTVRGIRIKEGSIPQDVEVGAELDLSNFVLILVYGRNDEEELPYYDEEGNPNPDIEITPFSTLEIRTDFLEVKYAGKVSNDYQINVINSIDHIELVSDRTYSFIVGAQPDLDVRIIVVYASGVKKEIGKANGVTVSAIDTSTVTAEGEVRSFTVEYSGKTATCNYTVVTDRFLSAITLKSNVPTVYKPGDELYPLESIVAELHYTTGEVVEIPAFVRDENDNLVANPVLEITGYDKIDTEKPDTYTVNLHYTLVEDDDVVEEIKGSFDVTVLSILHIEASGFVTALEVGEKFDTSNILVRLLLENGDVVEISGDKLIHNPASSSVSSADTAILLYDVRTDVAGKFTLVVKYLDKYFSSKYTVSVVLNYDGGDNTTSDVPVQ